MVLENAAADGFAGLARAYFIRALAFSADGRRLFAGHFYGGLRLGSGPWLKGNLSSWDLEDGRRLAIRDSPVGMVNALRLLPGDKGLIVAGDEGLAVWNLALSGEPARLGVGARKVTDMAIGPDGRLLAYLEGGVPRLWDLAASRPARMLRGHSWGVNGLAFFPDGKALATSGGDKVVRIWDPDEGRGPRVQPGRPRAGRRLLRSEGAAVGRGLRPVAPGPGDP
jgi:WD40 repeat protein